MTPPAAPDAPAGSAGEVFRAFARLGVSSFGGPIAHLGYYRHEFVERRKWLDEATYAELVALCQFLPGPASSQVNFAIGLMRAGPLGALAAFAAFSLPSALLMFAFAYGAAFATGPLAMGAVAGLKIVAVAVVAQAVWGMARVLCPDRTRAAIALGAVLLVTFASGAAGQIAAIALGGLAGLALTRNGDTGTGAALHMPVSPIAGIACLGLFALLLFGLPLLAASAPAAAVINAFYRSGALVFGGGHVVLPLLQQALVAPGWISQPDFLAGYGAAQALPGPLFTFAAYLGALLTPAPNGIAGAAIAYVAIFLPGFLLLIGVIPFWDRFRRTGWARAVMRGTNAAVVGILGAALYNPVFATAITGPAAFALALVCFVLLTVWKAPSWVAVLVAAMGGAALTVL